jgi:hypothetical protein
MIKIPPFRLIPEPLNDEAKKLLPFQWAGNEIGKRHQLGGEPTLIQKTEEIICKSCGNKLTFYAQIDSINDDIILADCGMIFIYVCFDCYVVNSFIQSY